jgi:uncharacterized protein involved in response to NO
MLLLALALGGVLGTAASALHALGIGAIGGMIIGMITRTARGHTGRPLIVALPEVLAYILVHLAALSRVVLPLLWPSLYAPAVVSRRCVGRRHSYCTIVWSILAPAQR